MPSLKELRNRIGSVKSTQKITQAMQMVAAAKLRRARETAESARPYAERMDAVLANLSAAIKDDEGTSPLMVGTGKEDMHLLIVATADRGLCGAFNSSIARLARDRALALKADGKQVKMICIGKKGNDILKRQFASQIIDAFNLNQMGASGYDGAAEIAAKILQLFDDGEFDVATLYYGRFKSVLTQVPTEQQIIPATLPEGENETTVINLGGAIYDYEPDERDILEDLLPRNLAIQIFRALLENGASEQGARMTAMDNATRNAGEMIDNLTIRYNRTRQAMITKELIEIISGAEAL
jgi:F-type H+-transporting ATPase subunit gamma